MWKIFKLNICCVIIYLIWKMLKYENLSLFNGLFYYVMVNAEPELPYNVVLGWVQIV